MRLYVYPKVGTTGLCNMLITWARAVVFAKKTGAQIIAPQWTNFCRIGTFIRREKDKRLYMKLFTNDGYITGLKRLWHLAFSNKIDEHKYADGEKGVVVFSGHEEGMRLVLKNQDLIRDEFRRITNPLFFKKLEELPKRFIGVHLRSGDFKKIGFSLSQDYYIRAIEIAQSRIGKDVPVLVFTDATERLDYLTAKFSTLRIMPKAPALQDIWSLSRSSILVATNRSTFSAWAAFLGNVHSLWDKNGDPPSTFLGMEDFELI